MSQTDTVGSETTEQFDLSDFIDQDEQIESSETPAEKTESKEEIKEEIKQEPIKGEQPEVKEEGKATQKAAPTTDAKDWTSAHEKLLKSRGWDPKSPDYSEKVTKSYAELEREFGRTKTEVNRLIKRDDETLGTVLSDIDSINDFRVKNGAPPIPKPIDYGQERQFVNTILNNIKKAEQGDQDALDAVYKALNDREREYLVGEEKSKLAKPQAQVTLNDMKAKARDTLNGLKAEVPEAQQYLEAITLQFLPENELGALGINVYKALSDENTARALMNIGEKLYKASEENIEKVVKARVEEEMKRLTKQKTSKPIGKEVGIGKNINIEEDAFSDFR